MTETTRPVGRPKKGPEYTHSALSTFKDPVSQWWKLVKIQYNTLGEVSPDMELVLEHPDKVEIDFQFKVNAAKLNVVG